MPKTIWLLTGLVIAIGALIAYWRTRDALHPAVIMAPPFFYFYCVWPFILDRNGDLEFYLPNDFYWHASIVFIAAIFALYVGLNSGPMRAVVRRQSPSFAVLNRLPLLIWRRYYSCALILGCIALVAYASLFDFNLGRFVRAYSTGKGGGYASSGYVGEATLLALPAVLMLALAVRLRDGRPNLQDIVLALLLVAPQLLHGTLGGRRGPLFMSLAVLFFSWFVARGRLPSIPQAIIAISLIGFAIIAVFANRQDVYIGSADRFDFTRAAHAIAGEINEGNEYVVATSTVETYRAMGDYFWGYRYFVTFFVRPVPRQMWPTKYEDMGAYWLTEVSKQEYQSKFYVVVGFIPLPGSSSGSIADGFSEFSYGVIVMFFLLGAAYAFVWRRHRREGGFWTVLLFLMLALSIYLPTQSFSAWMARLMFMGVVGAILWRFWIGPQATRRHPAWPGRRPL